MWISRVTNPGVLERVKKEEKERQTDKQLAPTLELSLHVPLFERDI